MSLASNLTQTEQTLTALLEYANNKTGKDDVSVGDAIKSLADGYGQGGGGNTFPYSGELLETIDTFSRHWTNADINFDFTKSSTTSQTIKTASSSASAGAYTATDCPAFVAGTDDIMVCQKLVIVPTYGEGYVTKVSQLKYVQRNIYMFSSRKLNENGTLTKPGLGLTYPLMQYYNSNNLICYYQSNTYGVCGSCVNPSGGTTNVTIYAPSVTVRSSSTYCSTANLKTITDIDVTWTGEIYRLKPNSTLVGAIVKDLFNEMNLTND